MGEPSITPDVYNALVAAFQSRPGNILAAADAVGVNRNTARKAWSGEYARWYSWAPSIRSVVARPSEPRDGGGRVATVSAIRPDRTIVARPVPHLAAPPPVADSLPVREPDDGGDTVRTAQDRLLATARRTLHRYLDAMERQAPVLASTMEFLTHATRSYAESLSGGALVTLRDLADLASIVATITTTVDRATGAAERLVAAERKLNPTTVESDSDGWAEAIGSGVCHE